MDGTKPKLVNLVLFYSVVLLIIFLPFSSWLVSMTGMVWISALRDLLVLAALLVALAVGYRGKKTPLTYLIVLFLMWILASYFWKEAVSQQWLKGARFLAGPFLLLLALLIADLKELQKKLIAKVFLGVAAIIGILAILDFAGLSLPLVSSLSGPGSLESSHYVGLLNVRRVQAILAGPNALGLYLLTGFALLSAWSKKNVLHYLGLAVTAAIIILTFSRSCLAGLLTMILIITFQRLNKHFGMVKSLLVIGAVLGAVTFAGWSLYNSDSANQYVTHNASSSQRIEQYQRIWRDKLDIGLVGRGPGTAGPSSQNRLDGGDNHWTENVYLDIFEELGIIGLLVYIGLIGYLLVVCSQQTTFWSRAAFYGLAGFSVAGIFLNYFTGQAGIWMLALMVGIAMNRQKN